MSEISIDDFKKVEIRVGEILSAEKIEKSDKLLKLRVSFGPKPVAAETTPAPGTEPAISTEQPAEQAEPTPAVAPELEVRQVLSGIAAFFPDPSVLVGKRVPFCTNLAPRMMMGLESQAMILATGDTPEAFSLFETNAAAGSRVK